MKRMRNPAVSVVTLATTLALVATPGTAQAQTQPPPPYAPPSPYGQPAQPPPAQAQPYGIQAGGLAPPPPMADPTPTTGPSATERQLQEAREKDSGRGLDFFWLNAEGGLQHVGLQTFRVDTEAFTAGFVPSTATGALIGAGLGVKLLFLTVGARARMGVFSDFQLYSVGPELGVRLPIGRVEPHVDLGLGYVGLGNLTGPGEALRISGYYARLGGGVDYFLTPTLSVGLNGSWEILGLTRPGFTEEDIQRIQDGGGTVSDAARAEDSSYGSAVSLTAVLGLHF